MQNPEVYMVTILMPGSPLDARGRHDGLLQNMLDRVSEGAPWRRPPEQMHCNDSWKLEPITRDPLIPQSKASSVFGAMDNAHASFRDPQMH